MVVFFLEPDEAFVISMALKIAHRAAKDESRKQQIARVAKKMDETIERAIDIFNDELGEEKKDDQ